jgi:phenylacetate 2-hydroxylase
VLDEIKSICLTMVSAGLDTVPGNLIMGIAYLSSPHGQEIQKRAYEEIMKVYPDGDAWERCLVEEKVPYVTAFVREVLRFFTVIPICLPRTSIKDIKYEDAVIPAGTTFYMVNRIPLSRFDLTDILYRTPGQQTMTKPTLKTPNPSS